MGEFHTIWSIEEIGWTPFVAPALGTVLLIAGFVLFFARDRRLAWSPADFPIRPRHVAGS